MLAGLSAGLAAYLWLLPPVRAGGTPPRPRPARRRTGLAVGPGALGLLAGGVVWFVVGGVLGLLGAAATALLLPRYLGGLESFAARRRRSELERQAPHIVGLMAAAVQSGASPSRALDHVNDLGDELIASELRPFARRLALGEPPGQVWADLAQHDVLGILGRTLRRGSTTGAPITQQMNRAAAQMRAHRHAELMARARSLEVRSTVPLGVCMLPAFICLGVVPMVAGLGTSLLGGS